MTIGEVARGRQRLGTGEQQARCDPALARSLEARTGPTTRSAPGASRAAVSPASRRTSMAARSPWRADLSTWCARPAAASPRAASTSAHRSWAPSRQPPAVASYTARRTSGCRKRKRRGTSVARMRSRCCSSSTASIAATSEIAAAAAASSGSNGSPATAAPSSAMRPPFDSSASSSFSEAATAGGPRCQSVKPREQRFHRALERPRELLEVERVATHSQMRAAPAASTRSPRSSRASSGVARPARLGSERPHGAPARALPQDAPAFGAGAGRMR